MLAAAARSGEIGRRRSGARLQCGKGKKVGRAKELLKPDEILEQVDSTTIAASPLPYNVRQGDVE